jgi:hypothetical protein
LVSYSQSGTSADLAFKRYDVDVDGARVRHYEPTPRLALRSSPSQED